MIYKTLSLHVGCTDSSEMMGREGERMVNAEKISSGIVTLAVCEDEVF